MSLENLIKTNQLKREPASQGEIEQLADAARRGLTDSGVLQISLESRFSLAYHAALQVANATLRLHDLRTTSNTKGAHVVAIQSLGLTLGVDPSTWRTLDAFRAKRHQAQYEGMHVTARRS